MPEPGIYRLVGSLPDGNRSYNTIELGTYYPDSVRYTLSAPGLAPFTDNKFREPLGPGQWGFTFEMVDENRGGYVKFTIERDGGRYLCSKLIVESRGPYQCSFTLLTPRSVAEQTGPKGV